MNFDDRDVANYRHQDSRRRITAIRLRQREFPDMNFLLSSLLGRKMSLLRSRTCVSRTPAGSVWFYSDPKWDFFSARVHAENSSRFIQFLEFLAKFRFALEPFDFVFIEICDFLCENFLKSGISRSPKWEYLLQSEQKTHC